MKNAAVYIRVSTDEQIEHSPESQLKELKDYAKKHDMLIDPQYIFIDAGISGRKAAKRPEFQRMIAAAKEKPSPFEVILVWKFSRFARNQEESILYKSLLRRSCNVDVVSITEETGDSMFGSLIERIIEWMDEFYSIRLGEEVRSKMAYVAEKGKVQTVASFGFSKKKGEDLVLNEAEVRWIKFMAEQVLQKKSLRAIATHLNDNGVRTHRGNGFEPRTIEYILRNPINAGIVHWTPHQNHEGRTPISSDTIMIEGAAPAIYDIKYHNAVVAELDRRVASRKKYDKPDTVKKHWLSGFLKCSNCGSALVFQNKNQGFQCYKYGKSLCTVSHYIAVKKIESAVLEAMRSVTITDDFIQSITRQDSPAVKDFSKELERLENMLSRAKAAYVEGIDTIDEYRQHKDKLTKEIEKIRANQEKREVSYLPKEQVRQKFSSVLELLQSDQDNDIKRSAFGEIVEKVIYSRTDDAVKIFFYL